MIRYGDSVLATRTDTNSLFALLRRPEPGNLA